MHKSIVHESFEFSVNLWMIDRQPSPGWGRIPAVEVQYDVGIVKFYIKINFESHPYVSRNRYCMLQW